MNNGQTPPLQREAGASSAGPSNPSNPALLVTAVSHLMTIESDVAGRSTVPVLFNVELFVDSRNHFQLLNVHRQGTTRPALPATGAASASDRARICAENSLASEENCDVDLDQLTRDGVVIERLLNRPGLTLKAEPGFSATAGGLLALRYIQGGDLQDASRDRMAEYSVRLERVNGQWIAISSRKPEKGAFTLMKLESAFSGLFASGIRSIQVGTSEQDLW